MTSRIVIEGDIARYEEVTIHAETPLVDLMPHLQTRLPTIFPLIPDNARVMGFNPQTNTGAVFVELPPARRRIRASLSHYNALQSDTGHNVNEEGYETFEIAFPYLIFAFGFTFHEREGAPVNFAINSWRLFQRPSRIMNMTDPLWIARLMNVDESGGICWGSTRADTTSLTGRIDEMVKSFSRTIFNPDLGMRRMGGYRSYSSWEKASNENALVFIDWPEWQTVPTRTVQTVIDEILGRRIPVADISEYTDAIPEPPNIFSVARAQEWFNRLDQPHQRRFLFALNQQLQGTEPPAAPAEEGDDRSAIQRAAEEAIARPTARPARRTTNG